jgi:hypothetical protein
MVAHKKHEWLRDAFGDYAAERCAVHIYARLAPRIVMTELKGFGPAERVSERS